jgi:hypothetical protein
MPLYICVESGPKASRARPILAVSDPGLVQAMLVALSDALGHDQPTLGAPSGERSLVADGVHDTPPRI